MDAYVRPLNDALHRHPLLAVALTNAVTAALALHVVSEGKPLAYVKKALFRAALAAVPRGVVDAELDKIRSKVAGSVIGHAMDGEAAYAELPAEGVPADAVVAALDRGAATDRERWALGTVSGAVYHGGDALTAVIGEAFKRYALSNPLHPDLFPSVRKVRARRARACASPPAACLGGRRRRRRVVRRRRRAGWDHVGCRPTKPRKGGRRGELPPPAPARPLICACAPRRRAAAASTPASLARAPTPPRFGALPRRRHPTRPGLQMESEVVSMTLALFHAGPQGCGTITSGGTESILM